ncbi:MAG: hypothetical protein GY861_19520 [bacterium]|nr:hypothetical protein [bacterium]
MKAELKPIEIEVVKHVAMGYYEKEIAKQLNIRSVRTVQSYIYEAKKKLGAKNPPQMVLKAHQEGYLDDNLFDDCWCEPLPPEKANILGLKAEGYTAKQISKETGKSMRAVEGILSCLYKKIHNTTQETNAASATYITSITGVPLEKIVGFSKTEGLYTKEILEEPVESKKLFTPREKEVIELLASGYSVPQMADQIIISPRTAEEDIKNAREKVGAKNTAHLMRRAVETGEIDSSVLLNIANRNNGTHPEYTQDNLVQLLIEERSRLDALHPRRYEILGLESEGYKQGEIAGMLNISRKTVQGTSQETKKRIDNEGSKNSVIFKAALTNAFYCQKAACLTLLS